MIQTVSGVRSKRMIDDKCPKNFVVGKEFNVYIDLCERSLFCNTSDQLF